MGIHCKVCDNTFKKFVLFEGHFDFNNKCKEKHNFFMQCYFCKTKFQHSAALKYHLQQHTIKRIKKSPKKQYESPAQSIPKITLKKQWNFKIVPPAEGADVDNQYGESENRRLKCKICKKQYRSVVYLEQHMALHEKKVIFTSRQTNDNEKCVTVPTGPSKSTLVATSVSNTKSPSASSAITTFFKIPQRFSCGICNLKMRHGGARLARHVQSHANGKYKCEICNIKFLKSSLTWHQKYFHGMSVGPFSCDTCDAHFTQRESLEKHKKVHTDGQVKCEKCNIRFTPMTLVNHMKQKHPESVDTSSVDTKSVDGKDLKAKNTGMKNIAAKKIVEKSIKTPSINSKCHCKICQAIIKRKNLAQHMLNHKIGKFKCEKCNIRFSLFSLIWHQKRQHPEINTRLTAREYNTCNICKATFHSKSYLRKHLLLHKTGNVKCDVCNIRFTANSLFIHQKKCHTKLENTLVKQPCEVCGQRLYSKAALDLHADMHQNGEHQCDIHKIKFTFRALQVHNRRCHPDRSAQIEPCPICKQTFNKKYIDRHMNVHVNGDEKCEICNIRFTPPSLVYHQKTVHRKLYYGVPKSIRQMRKKLFDKQRKQQKKLQQIAQKLKFQCKLCKLRFDHDKKLEIHMKVHDYGNVQCRICNIPFTKNSLAFHEKRFHLKEMRKERILKALQRHISDELRTLNESESKEIPIILEDHYKQLTTETELPYHCIICKLPCALGSHLDRHITTHLEGDYKCEICFAWFTKNSLDSHQKRFHLEFYEERIKNGIQLTKELCDDGEENVFSEKKIVNQYAYCDICKVNCGGYEKLVEHSKIHLTGDVECKVCNIRFTVHSLRYHQRRFHPEMQPDTTVVEHNCNVCNLICSDEKRLKTHMTVHTEADVECEICNIPFTKPSLLYHMRRFHEDVHCSGLEKRALERNTSAKENIHRANDGQFHCIVCNLDCRYRKHLVNHIKVHIDGDVKCQICEIWFTKQSLEYHYKHAHRELNVTRNTNQDSGTKDQSTYQCNVCKMVVREESRLKEHMRVHRGNIKCSICKIAFTKAALSHHYKLFHPNVPKRILKSIENCASRKNLHNCYKCGKSFTRICYLKLHMKTHRNASEPVEIPFVFDVPLSIESNSNTNDLLIQQSDTITDTYTYECYVCKEYFSTSDQLERHLGRHVVFVPWVDPLTIKLSNFNPDHLEEIISNQPLVLAENMRNVNLESFLAFCGQSNRNHVEDVQESDASVCESDPKNIIKMDPEPVNDNLTIVAAESVTVTVVDMENDNDDLVPDTTQNDDEIVEILSDSDDEDRETIRYQLNNNMNGYNKHEFRLTQNCADETLYISSDDDEDQGDITDSFHCFYCNARFRTSKDFGEHQKNCFLNPEPDI